MVPAGPPQTWPENLCPVRGPSGCICCGSCAVVGGGPPVSPSCRRPGGRRRRAGRREEGRGGETERQTWEKGREREGGEKAKNGLRNRNGQRWRDAKVGWGDSERGRTGEERMWRGPWCPFSGQCSAPRSPLTCLGQGASGAARLGDSVLSQLRQGESQATKLLLHLLVGESSMRGALTELAPPRTPSHLPATTSSCLMVSSRPSSSSRMSWVCVGLRGPPPGTPPPSGGGPAPLSSSEGSRSCFRDSTGQGQGVRVRGWAGVEMGDLEGSREEAKEGSSQGPVGGREGGRQPG